MYKFEKDLGISAEKAFGMISKNLKDTGYVLLSYVDVKEIIRNKFGEDFPYYFMLDVCKPAAARELISRNQDYGLFLPCKIVIAGDQEKSKVMMLRVSEMAETHLGDSREHALKFEEELVEMLKNL